MVKNEDGYVKCINPQGKVVWVGDHIALNAHRMKKIGLALAPEPIKLEPIINVVATDNIQPTAFLEPLPDCPNNNEAQPDSPNTTITRVAEAPKKRGRKPKIN